MKNILGKIFLVTILAMPAFAFALSLDEAKGKGLVGEQESGYLGAVANTPEVAQLVEDINNKRRDQYTQIAQKNGTPIATVEALAGKKAIANTPPGGYVKSGNGQWVKK